MAWPEFESARDFIIIAKCRWNPSWGTHQRGRSGPRQHCMQKNAKGIMLPFSYCDHSVGWLDRSDSYFVRTLRECSLDSHFASGRVWSDKVKLAGPRQTSNVPWAALNLWLWQHQDSEASTKVQHARTSIQSCQSVCLCHKRLPMYYLVASFELTFSEECVRVRDTQTAESEECRILVGIWCHVVSASIPSWFPHSLLRNNWMCKAHAANASPTEALGRLTWFTWQFVSLCLFRQLNCIMFPLRYCQCTTHINCLPQVWEAAHCALRKTTDFMLLQTKISKPGRKHIKQMKNPWPVRCSMLNSFGKFLPGETACWSGSKYITNFQPGFSGSQCIKFDRSKPGKDIGWNRAIKIAEMKRTSVKILLEHWATVLLQSTLGLLFGNSDGQFEAVRSPTGSRLRGQTLSSRTSWRSKNWGQDPPQLRHLQLRLARCPGNTQRGPSSTLKL